MQIHKAMASVLTESEMNAMIWSYDRIGDILITTLPDALHDKAARIGNIYMTLHPGVKVVARRNGGHQGEFRTRRLVVIAGENRTHTVHRENGVRLALDLDQMYYSVRLAGERLRLARQVKDGERVAVLCSGVGPFPLTMARHSNARLIVGIEKNPSAHQFALCNVQLNKAEKTVRLQLGDARQELPGLGLQFDRLVTVLPTGDGSLLTHALPAIVSGGTLHYYAMVSNRDPGPVLEVITRACIEAGKVLQSVAVHRCGHCGPRTDRCCFTVELQ